MRAASFANLQGLAPMARGALHRRRHRHRLDHRPGAGGRRPLRAASPSRGWPGIRGLDPDASRWARISVARLTPTTTQRAPRPHRALPAPRSALIPMLHMLQEQDGYLTEDGMEHVAELARPDTGRGAGHGDFLRHVPPRAGRPAIWWPSAPTSPACCRVRTSCSSTPRSAWAWPPAGPRADGMFTLEDAECLALCGNAPCLTVNWRFFGDVTRSASTRWSTTSGPAAWTTRCRRTAPSTGSGRGPAAGGAVPAARPPDRPGRHRRPRRAARAGPHHARRPPSPGAADTSRTQPQRRAPAPSPATRHRHRRRRHRARDRLDRRPPTSSARRLGTARSLDARDLPR